MYQKYYFAQNDTLQFIGHEEGRARWALHHYVNGSTGYGFEYDYFLKDHLGNTRMVLTQEKDTSQYIATMEAAYRSTENQLFYNIPQTSYPRVSVAGYPTDNTTVPNDSLARVNGNGPKTGPSILLKVMSGDVVDIATKSFYKSGGTVQNPNNTFTDILNSLAGGIVTATSGSHGAITDFTNSSGPVYAAVNGFLPTNDPNTTGKPKAYLNWILLDDQFKGVSTYPQSGAIVVGSADVLNTLAYSGIPITKNGYLYIWVSNETPGWDAFFDNLSIKQYSGPITEETHYYPFGLTMSGISSQAAGSMPNKYKFGGKELQSKEFGDNSGLELYDFHARNYDPQIGRWWVNDPKADKSVWISPYNYCLNNPLKFSDPDGKFPYPVTVSSFAPPGSFKGRWGMGFEDDHRGFSANKNVTSRISQTYTVDPTKRTISGGSVTSSDTKRNGQTWNATNTTDEGKIDNTSFSKNKFGSDVATVDAHFNGSNPAFHGLAPNIEVKSRVTLSENDKRGYVVASVDLSSKQFPATEATITDPSGQSVLLVGAAAYGDPHNLMNADVLNAASIDVKLDIDGKGNFTGVEYGGNKYSVADWKKMQEAKPAGPLPREDKDKKQGGN